MNKYHTEELNVTLKSFIDLKQVPMVRDVTHLFPNIPDLDNLYIVHTSEWFIDSLKAELEKLPEVESVEFIPIRKLT